MRLDRTVLAAIGGGLLLNFALPPWGWWPLTFAGLVVLDRLVGSAALSTRWWRSWWLWLAMFVPSLFWMRALTLPGYVIACLAYAAFLATGTVLAPRGTGRWLAIPGGIVLAEWVRWHWPFGGVPLSNLAIAQVSGPLAPVLRIGGGLLLVWVTAVAGMALAAGLRRRWKPAAALAGIVVAVTGLAAFVAPDGHGTGRFLDVALVQGGGEQGTRADDTDARDVTEAHLAASELVETPVDLVLWPEDVVDIESLEGSQEQEELSALARELDAVLVVGVIEDVGEDRFRNLAVVYDAAGDEVDRYEKVERVPFGEWVPLRDLLEVFAGDALPERDALVGDDRAVVDTPVGRLGVSVSWEIFFDERARDAIGDDGGTLLLNPTNGSSFEGTLVQSQQVANSRMRAVETGRWVTQIAPTGFSALIEPDGTVVERTDVSERRVVHGTVELRTGRTWAMTVGQNLALVLAVGGIAAGWIWDRRRARSRQVDHDRDGTVVDQGQGHVGTEAAGGHRDVELSER